METQRVVDFSRRSVDKRPRKRPRLAWDMPPVVPPPKVFLLSFSYAANFTKFVSFLDSNL